MPKSKGCKNVPSLKGYMNHYLTRVRWRWHTRQMVWCWYCLWAFVALVVATCFASLALVSPRRQFSQANQWARREIVWSCRIHVSMISPIECCYPFYFKLFIRVAILRVVYCFSYIHSPESPVFNFFNNEHRILPLVAWRGIFSHGSCKPYKLVYCGCLRGVFKCSFLAQTDNMRPRNGQFPLQLLHECLCLGPKIDIKYCI